VSIGFEAIRLKADSCCCVVLIYSDLRVLGNEMTLVSIGCSEMLCSQVKVLALVFTESLLLGVRGEELASFSLFIL
jgi:hypothetical protein